MANIWQILWFVSEKKKEELPHWTTPIIESSYHEPSEEMKKIKEIEEKEYQKNIAKKRIWLWDGKNMFEWLERWQYRRLRQAYIKPIPKNDNRDHRHGNIDRVLKMSQEQVDLERWKRFQANMDEVFSHINKTKHEANS